MWTADCILSQISMNYEQGDKLHIRNLVVPAVIGIHPRERSKAQDIILNISIYTEIVKAAKTDNIAQALDYEALCTRLVEYVRTSSFMLIESLADAIAKFLLDTEGILACKIVLDKPGALNLCESVAVEIFRESKTPP